jgi:hypothetical protein
MVDRWLPWIASAAVLGVFLPPLVSAPSVEMSPVAIPKAPVSVSELIEPPPMTELAGDKSRSFEPPPAANEEARSQPPIAVSLPGTVARDHSLRRPAPRHVALHHHTHRRICCVAPLVDKAGN